MATTTSTENSGLLSYLLPKFESTTGIRVQAIAVGTGSALKYGENGDVDVVLVHAKNDELAFVAAGFGVERRAVMHNDFVVVGPRSDPAALRGATGAAEAFCRIAQARAPFVSRGDESGTHKKERLLWDRCGIRPRGAWYLEAGQGMEAVLVVASQKQAYTLTDRATFAAVSDNVNLTIAFDGDTCLLNEYGVIAVNPSRHKRIRYAQATQFIEWLTSPAGQNLIRSFRINGQQLFFTNSEHKP